MLSGSMPGSAEPVKPLLRGVFHQYAFLVSLVLGALLAFHAQGGRALVAALAFASSVAAMFGMSALYHRASWSPGMLRLMRRLDHAAIFGVITGTYTAFGLLALHGAWRLVVLSIVWSGSFAAIALKVFWVEAPEWLPALISVALGWVGLVAFPLLVDAIGLAGSLLVLAGGVCYTLGALVYTGRRPDLLPRVFGFHELFHALVVVAVGLQYAAVAFFLLPSR